VVGQSISGALAGNTTVDAALKAGQAAANRAVVQGGYQKLMIRQAAPSPA
jgi:sorbitol/mannitol transport system substrate-binding protein